MFDLDGTLSDGIENFKVVQACLDKGYEVGIATAGGRYTIDTLSGYSWIPENLIERMRQTGFATFNNVVGDVLVGKFQVDAYKDIDLSCPEGIDIYGWRKGFACNATANLLGITCRIIMFDDLSSYIEGVKAYNPDIQTVCAGVECNGKVLSMDTLNSVVL